MKIKTKDATFAQWQMFCNHCECATECPLSDHMCIREATNVLEYLATCNKEIEIPDLVELRDEIDMFIHKYSRGSECTAADFENFIHKVDTYLKYT